MPQKLLCLLASSLVLCTGSAICKTVPEQDQAIAVAQEVERIARKQNLWPGFEPLAVPLAIFHRDRTYLFRHPAPPAGFTKSAQALVLEGRHPGGYVIGSALAVRLDRTLPEWQRSLEQNDQQFLDILLDSALTTSSSCAFTPDEIAKAEVIAQQDVARVSLARVERRKQFDAREGWRITIVAADNLPLMPQGFDPLNVERVEGGLLHTRFLRLGNGAGELQAMDSTDANIELLTEAAGRHPLFNGVRRVAIKGVAKPEITSANGQSTVQAPGFTARFKNADLQSSGTEVRILLQRAP